MSLNYFRKVFRSYSYFEEIKKLHENCLGPPGTSEVLRKIFSSVKDFVEHLQLHENYLGPTGTLRDFEKFKKNIQ